MQLLVVATEQLVSRCPRPRHAGLAKFAPSDSNLTVGIESAGVSIWLLLLRLDRYSPNACFTSPVAKRCVMQDRPGQAISPEEAKAWIAAFDSVQHYLMVRELSLSCCWPRN
jgi:hypothetical protein